MPEAATPSTWAVVELMGHVKLAGRLSEEERFGAKMGRLDIPTSSPCSCANGPGKLADLPPVPCEKCDGSGIVHGFLTQHFGGSSVYRITYVSEDVARHIARSATSAPVSPWDFPKAALPAPTVERAGDYFDDDEDRDERRRDEL